MTTAAEKTQTAPNELNGWNIDAINDAIEALRQEPSAGRLTWRSRVAWDGGFGLDVRTKEIEQRGGVLKRHFTMRGDHPQELLGRNTGPTAVETLLAALGACMTGTFAAQATARGISIHALEVDVEGAIDLNGFFGLQPVRPGLSDVRLTFRVSADADARALRETLDAARSLSPVFDTISRSVPIETSVK